MFAVLSLYWFEGAVGSEIEADNTIENYRLPQCETEHKYTLRKYRRSKELKHKELTLVN